jgi:AcrR family transcriptional regulator
MTANDNSVNMMSRRYHHGDLRAALIEAGLAMLRERAADDVSLREIARAVGVSATAVYRHFPDKQALLDALAYEGMEALGRAQRAASDAAGGGEPGFAASGATYVRFAVENPALFRLAFASAPPVSLMDAPPDKAGTAMRGLREDIARLLPPDIPEADRRAAALHAWSLVHGLAMLILDGQIAYDPHEIGRILHAGEKM